MSFSASPAVYIYKEKAIRISALILPYLQMDKFICDCLENSDRRHETPGSLAGLYYSRHREQYEHDPRWWAEHTEGCCAGGWGIHEFGEFLFYNKQ